MIKRLYAPVYMHQFSCLGGECEDTCCQNWDIHLDKKHYEIIEQEITGNEEHRQVFSRYVCRNADKTASERNYAFIKLNDSGFCPFLDQSGLCHLHAEFGVELLSNICAFFPRVFSFRDKRTEMTGALSCPEVVRRCFFSAADDYQIAPADIDIPRSEFPLSRDLSSDENLYANEFTVVNDQMLGLINDEQYAFETRLYFLANFTYRMSSHYHQGYNGNIKPVEEEIRRINRSETLKQLDTFFFQFNTSEPIAMIIVQSILQLRIQFEGNDKLSRLAGKIFEHYRQDINTSEDFDVFGDNVPPDILWQRFQQHWEKLNSKYGTRLERYLTRYVTNVLQREWFVSMPNPFVYVHMICIRVAILRFLITSHPEMIKLIYSSAQGNEALEMFDALAVKVVYLFARSIDHNLNFLQVVFHAIAEQELMSFDYSLPLIKF